MKKILFVLLLSIFLIPNVNADDSIITYDIMERDYIPLDGFTYSYETYETYWSSGYLYTNFDEFIKDPDNREIFETLYFQLLNYYKENYDGADYTINVAIKSTSSSSFKLDTIALTLDVYSNVSINLNTRVTLSNSYHLGKYYGITRYGDGSSSTVQGYHNPFSIYPFKVINEVMFFSPTSLFESSFDITITNTTSVWNIYDSNSTLIESYSAGDTYPVLYKSGEYISAYETVNLDDYEYVILSLKDYSQTEAFDTSMQVKGMIGITPVYEFGTVEKETITDRCNLSYSSFTDYRLYILKNDLLNNAVYYVKQCQENSSFRYDSTIFNITYVTAANVDDPVITVGGVEYHTIPFDQLTTTANSNEESNFIPGASEEFSIADAIDNVTSYITSFWKSLTTFMGLVTKFFNTLPIEIRAVSITFFTTGCVLGLLKILKH